MIIGRIKFKKCPHCKQYGIPISLNLFHKTPPKVTCKYCKKVFAVNLFLHYIILYSLLFFFCFLLTHVRNISTFWCMVGMVLSCLVVEYIVPLQEVED